MPISHCLMWDRQDIIIQHSTVTYNYSHNYKDKISFVERIALICGVHSLKVQNVAKD